MKKNIFKKNLSKTMTQKNLILKSFFCMSFLGAIIVSMPSYGKNFFEKAYDGIKKEGKQIEKEGKKIGNHISDAEKKVEKTVEKVGNKAEDLGSKIIGKKAAHALHGVIGAQLEYSKDGLKTLVKQAPNCIANPEECPGKIINAAKKSGPRILKMYKEQANAIKKAVTKKNPQKKNTGQ